MNDNHWLDQMIQAEPQARQQIDPADQFAPTGERSDANLLYADLLAGPDTSADPFAKTDRPAASPA